MDRPPLPPFTEETAAQKARLAEDAWSYGNENWEFDPDLLDQAIVELTGLFAPEEGLDLCATIQEFGSG